jgi:hypothetical protein
MDVQVIHFIGHVNVDIASQSIGRRIARLPRAQSSSPALNRAVPQTAVKLHDATALATLTSPNAPSRRMSCIGRASSQEQTRGSMASHSQDPLSACLQEIRVHSRITPASFNPSRRAPHLAVSRLYEGTVDPFRHLWMLWSSSSAR